MTAEKKFVYFFGAGASEGTAQMRDLLGGKGANLADMASLGLPVPPGFTITTEACAEYGVIGKAALFEKISPQVNAALKRLEEATGKTFGKGPHPLLVSVRSGAAASMPGMMDTILNLGLNEETCEAMIALTGNERFVLDSYRRFIQMFSDVVLHVNFDEFEHALEAAKKAKNVKLDTELDANDLRALIVEYKKIVKNATGNDFPSDPMEQLYRGAQAVFDSWDNPRAIRYRQLNDIRGLLGTAVNIQAMVFGNSGNNSATGVAFTRDPSTGDNEFFYGEFLINAQGEDVVAGIRTPQQITIKGSRKWAEAQGVSEADRAAKYPSLEEAMPECFKQLDAIRIKLENHYKDMQDLEFTIENGKLYMLQTRNGKRTAAAAVKGSKPEIMIPLVGNVKELSAQKAVVLKAIAAVEAEKGVKLDIKIGTMIEVPRAAVTADKIAEEAEFFSFGTNDLTQMGCGFSRDDAGKFLGDYVKWGIYDYDPFQVLDTEGVGELVRIAVGKGRSVRSDITLGICGEHGGEPRTIAFCHEVGLNYVSCSPFRVPIARLAAAQAAIKAAM